MIAPFALSIAIVAAQSQPPSPTPAKAGQRPQGTGTDEQGSTAIHQATTSPPPTAPNQTPIPQSQLAIQQASGQKESASATNWWLVFFTGALVIVGALQVWTVIRQNRIMENQSTIMTDQATAASDNVATAKASLELNERQQTILRKQSETLEKQHAAIQEQAGHMAEGLELTRQQLTLTSDGLLETRKTADAAKKSADAFMLAERAYVGISHKPPGVDISSDNITRAGEEHFGGYHEAVFRFEIKNSGNTPATITDVSIAHYVGTAIPDPPTGPGTGERLFLLGKDSVLDKRVFSLRHNDVTGLGLTLRLWILGYVDYIDKFGRRHRSGYARVYDPSIDANEPIIFKRSAEGSIIQGLDKQRHDQRNNMPFVTQLGYNYDRERTKDEGNDWDEPQK